MSHSSGKLLFLYRLRDGYTQRTGETYSRRAVPGREQYANIEQPKTDQTSLHQPKAPLA